MPFRIYTKTGDAGETSLFGGRRVSKADLRVEAYGTVDELNAFAGALRDQLSDPHQRAVLFEIQNRLFSIGSSLASDPDRPLPPADLTEADVLFLESQMDAMDAELPELRNFILPGGHPSVSAAHICRTVCRRAERLVVALRATQPVDALLLQYLNRLSDFFFVLSRKIGLDVHANEVIWVKRS